MTPKTSSYFPLTLSLVDQHLRNGCAFRGRRVKREPRKKQTWQRAGGRATAARRGRFGGRENSWAHLCSMGHATARLSSTIQKARQGRARPGRVGQSGTGDDDKPAGFPPAAPSRGCCEFAFLCRRVPPSIRDATSVFLPPKKLCTRAICVQLCYEWIRHGTLRSERFYNEAWLFRKRLQSHRSEVRTGRF